MVRNALRFDDLSGLELFVAAGRDGTVRQRTVLDSAGGLRFGDAVEAAFVLGRDRFTVTPFRRVGRACT
jgi:hypothetical protein